MSKYSNQLKQFDISGRTAFVDVPELGDGARIEIRPSSESNPPYYNALLRLSVELAKENKRKVRMNKESATVDDVKSARADDAQLFPKYIFVSWNLIHGDTGEPIPFNEEEGKELCDALLAEAPQVFDRIRAAADNDQLFYELNEKAGDPAELAENSDAVSSGS